MNKTYYVAVIMAFNMLTFIVDAQEQKKTKAEYVQMRENQAKGPKIGAYAKKAWYGKINGKHVVIGALGIIASAYALAVYMGYAHLPFDPFTSKKQDAIDKESETADAAVFAKTKEPAPVQCKTELINGATPPVVDPVDHTVALQKIQVTEINQNADLNQAAPEQSTPSVPAVETPEVRVEPNTGEKESEQRPNQFSSDEDIQQSELAPAL
jgi:hypothetical protein